MSHYSEQGKLSPVGSRAEFLALVERGQFQQLTTKDIESGLIPWNLDKYTVRDIRTYFDEILGLLDKDWSVFQSNFSALDIACGSMGERSEGFYPWLSAILAKLGATVYGIDIGPQPDQLVGLYHHTVFDLAELPASGLRNIPEIAGKQFDLVTFLNTITPHVPSDVMTRIAMQKGKTLTEIQNSILNGIGDMVKENGLLYMDTMQEWQQAYKKIEGELVQVK